MLILSQGTGHLIQLVTDAAGDIEPSVAYVDKVAGTGGFQYNFTGAGDPLASITTATTTTTIAGAASTERSIRKISYYNNHASQAVTCTVQEIDGTHTVTHSKVVLAAGETLSMDAAGVWTHYDANMGPYVGVGPIATQAEMEAATSTTVVVTPGRQHYHPSACKCWGKANGAGTSLVVNYNVTSITDTGTGRLTVTIATDFSSADYAAVTSLERVATTLTVATVDNGGNFRNAAMAAGSFEIENYDDTATTHVAQDPSSYFWCAFGDHA